MSSRIKIELITVGSLPAPLKVSVLESWNSDLLSLTHGASIGAVPDASGGRWEYPDGQLQQLVQPSQTAHLTIALVGGPLQQNYYSRRLPGCLVVLSMFQTAEILRASQVPMENFILRTAYAHVVYYHVHGGVVPTSGEASLSHQETRGCLFDLNANKADLAVSASRPMLCPFCKARLQHHQTPPRFWQTLDRELARIRKPLYFRSVDWIQSHPVLALLLTTLFALLLNLGSSAIYDVLKGIWSATRTAQCERVRTCVTS